jgi:hypothetical protein
MMSVEKVHFSLPFFAWSSKHQVRHGGTAMLVLTRKIGEEIIIDEDIRITR